MEKEKSKSSGKRTPDQSKQLHATLARLGMMDSKKDLAFTYSNGRTDSTSELTEFECDQLLRDLRRNLPLPKKVQKGDSNQDPADKMRKKILSICHEMGWENLDGSIDWKVLNGWLKKYGYLHLPLNAYELDELPQLVTQFENLLKSFYASRKSNNKA